MNIQESFTKFLKEEPYDAGQAYGFARVGAPGGVPSIDDVVMGDPFTLSPENIYRLNAYLSAAGASPVINPYFLVNRIQTKLAQIGLQFDMPKMMGDNGSVSVPVTQFGGTTGYAKPLGEPYTKAKQHLKDVTYPKMVDGDGLSNRVQGGLDIKFDWTCFKGLYTINVELVPGSKVEPKSIKESEDNLPKVGDKVKSNTHGTVGFLHHINVRGKAWVSDKPDGSEGQYFHHDDLVKHNPLKDQGVNEVHIGFDKLKNKLAHEKGITNPGAIAAAIGDKKYGKKKMAAAAHAHKELHEDEINEVSPAGWSGTVKAMKKHKEITNPFALAYYLKKKGDKPHYASEK